MPSTSPNRLLRVALLGAGGITVTHLTALQSLPGVEVIGICDLDEKKARGLQEQYGIPQAFPDLDEMLTRTSPDVVHVLLPAALHADGAERCLAAGCHVFVEKPFCISLAECRRVSAAAERAGRQVGVNHNLTFMPRFLELIDALRACRLGAIEHVAVTYSLPLPVLAGGPHSHWMFGGTDHVMLELGPHPLSTICRLLGRVTAASTAVSGEMTLSSGTRFFRTWQSALICERGHAQCLLATGAGDYAASVHVLGEDGQAFVDLRRNTMRLSEKSRYLRTADLADGWKNARQLATQSLRNFLHYGLGTVGLAPAYSLQNLSVQNSISDFYDALQRGRRPATGAAEGTWVVEACHMVLDSAARFLAEKGAPLAADR